ncbi:hypothetical protein GC087_18240 [Pantoea sp. JZ2]|uniref:hypothetical protein n=1 Tax=Pantoea sp. JZ2 TaxID=2654189 RepID=UPI002B495C1F|nr:hypothetical protein [Pantoea sp. JZ2]WRH14403.1 hypothetical protein GC087_18240 [Pantoea sp. JZ2]
MPFSVSACQHGVSHIPGELARHAGTRAHTDALMFRFVVGHVMQIGKTQRSRIQTVFIRPGLRFNRTLL